MFDWLKRKDTATDALLKHLEACKNQAPKATRQVSAKVLDALSDAVQNQWTRQHVKNYAAQVAQGATHEKFIYDHIMKTCGDVLQSGKVHACRGVLNDEGMQYLGLFNHAIDRLISLGCYTQDWAEEHLRAPVQQGILETD